MQGAPHMFVPQLVHVAGESQVSLPGGGRRHPLLVGSQALGGHLKNVTLHVGGRGHRTYDALEVDHDGSQDDALRRHLRGRSGRGGFLGLGGLISQGDPAVRDDEQTTSACLLHQGGHSFLRQRAIAPDSGLGQRAEIDSVGIFPYQPRNLLRGRRDLWLRPHPRPLAHAPAARRRPRHTQTQP